MFQHPGLLQLLVLPHLGGTITEGLVKKKIKKIKR
jgi:hypothetical protein